MRKRDPDKTGPNLGLRDLVVEQVPVCSLKPYDNNPRTHSKKQIRQLATSITTFGWTNPVLVDADNRIIAGHGRVEAAKLLGNPRVPVLRIEDLTEAQIKAYVIADNKLAELAGWDAEILANELQLLSELDLDFDLEVTGFEMGEIDVLIESRGGEHDPADDVPDVDNARSPVTLLGDVWLLGPHRLACGDALSRESYGLLMGHRRAQMVFTDPPYNVSVKGILTANGRVKHPEFLMASGEMSSEEFVEFLAYALGHHAAYSQQGAIHFICMDWRHLGELLRAGEAVYSELKNLCVWKKTNAGMGSFYRSQHELVFVFRHGDGPTINNIQLGVHGRNRTNIWEYAGQNVVTSERMQALIMHPTVKPVRLVADAILDPPEASDCPEGETRWGQTMSKKRARLRQEDHDPKHLRKVLDAAKRNELASFIQAAFGIVNPGAEYKHNFHIEAIAHQSSDAASVRLGVSSSLSRPVI